MSSHGHRLDLVAALRRGARTEEPPPQRPRHLDQVALVLPERRPPGRPSSRTRRWCRPGSCAPTVAGPTTTRSWTTTSPLGSSFDSGAALTRPTSRTSFTPTIAGVVARNHLCQCLFPRHAPSQGRRSSDTPERPAPLWTTGRNAHTMWTKPTARCEQSGTAGSRRRNYSDMSEEFATTSCVLATTTQTCPRSRHDIRGGFWPPLLRHVRVVVAPRAARWTSSSAPIARDPRRQRENAADRSARVTVPSTSPAGVTVSSVERSRRPDWPPRR